LKLVQNEI